MSNGRSSRFDKTGAPKPSNYRSAYAWLDWRWRYHHQRLKRFIDAMPRKLLCQECSGAGGETDPVPGLMGAGPWMTCGFCEGLGYLTPWQRGQWLRWKREDRKSYFA